MKNNVSIIYKSHTLYSVLIRILYGKYFLNRYRDLKSYIPIGDTVLDVCSGDCNLYHLAIKGRNQYTGIDLNISTLKKNKNVSVGDFINPDKRKETLDKVKKRGKNTIADTLGSLSNELKK